MTCRKCGAPMPDGQAFCSRCGTPVTNNVPTPNGPRPQMPPVDPRITPQNVYRDPYQPQNGPSIDPNFLNPSGSAADRPGMVMVMRIVMGILAAAYLLLAIKGIFSTLYSILTFTGSFIISRSWYASSFSIFNKLFYLLRLLMLLVSYLGFLAMGAVLGLTAFNPKQEHARGHFAGIAASTLAILVFFPLQYLLYLISGFKNFFIFPATSLFLTMAIALLVLIVSFILMSLVGTAPLTSFSVASFKDALHEVFPTLMMDIDKLNAGRNTSARKVEKDPQIHSSSFQAGPQNAPIVKPRVRLDTNRSLLKYIIFSCLTCGIYNLFFLNKLAHDVNIACDGDGEPETVNIITEIGLNMITCNLYSNCKYFNLANRLHANGTRYGVDVPIDGNTYLLWGIPGSLLCFIGPLVAYHKLFKSVNVICAAYNKVNGLD